MVIDRDILFEEDPVEYCEKCDESAREMRDYVFTLSIRVRHYLNPLEVYSKLVSCKLSSERAMRISKWYDRNIFRRFERNRKGLSKILKTSE